MDKLLAITLNTFQETLRRRVFYIVLLLALLVLIAIGSQMFFLRMARQAGETKMITTMGMQIIQMILGVWQFAALFLALFLGAIGISSELSARTIIHIMSRPVERWIYLLGRWFGILIFLWIFLFVGIGGALLVSLWLHIPFAPTLWLAFAELYVAVTFYSGVALGFSVVVPPVLAGIIAFLLTMLPNFVEGAIRNPRWLYRIPALIGYYLGPAQMPVNLMGESFAKERLQSDYWLYLRVLAENSLYFVAVLIIASLIFRRREIRVR